MKVNIEAYLTSKEKLNGRFKNLSGFRNWMVGPVNFFMLVLLF